MTSAPRTAGLGHLALRAALAAVALLACAACATPAPTNSVTPPPTLGTSPHTTGGPAPRTMPEDPAIASARARADAPATAIRCLTGPGPGTRALAVAQPTTEGDPIVSFFLRPSAGPTIEIDTSTHADSFGPKTWLHSACATTSVTDWRSLLLCGS